MTMNKWRTRTRKGMKWNTISKMRRRGKVMRMMKRTRKVNSGVQRQPRPGRHWRDKVYKI